ncbi:MAG: uracil-DNA glycosylase family protein [Limnochordia bacterium]|nr:uracil-DNA glycosylase family protein [Limnochordia bacterium]
MDVFQRIREEIAADPMNGEYTRRGIPPLFKASGDARLVIVGQAPGRRAEETRLFWNDPSGDRLREWLGLTREEFYASPHLAQLPMDFYYPGKGKSGDLPPRRGFAEKWHPRLLAAMPQVETIILVGSYGQRYYLGSRYRWTLTETVRSFRDYLPRYLPLVHPSPRNTAWLKQNPWFEREVLPVLREITTRLLEL